MNNMNDFLSKDVDKLEKPSNYMKLVKGENKFRPLGSMITGWEGWKTGEDGSKKPIRFRTDDKIPMNAVDDDQLKPFYAFPVYNRSTETIQILEVTQKGIQKAIKALARNEDWGSPVGDEGYDITITREGEGMETEYSVAPSPKKRLEDGIMQTYKDMHIRLEALYDGEDPFASESKAEIEVDPGF